MIKRKKFLISVMCVLCVFGCLFFSCDNMLSGLLGGTEESSGENTDTDDTSEDDTSEDDTSSGGSDPLESNLPEEFSIKYKLTTTDASGTTTELSYSTGITSEAIWYTLDPTEIIYYKSDLGWLSFLKKEGDDNYTLMTGLCVLDEDADVIKTGKKNIYDKLKVANTTSSLLKFDKVTNFLGRECNEYKFDIPNYDFSGTYIIDKLTGAVLKYTNIIGGSDGNSTITYEVTELKTSNVSIPDFDFDKVINEEVDKLNNLFCGTWYFYEYDDSSNLSKTDITLTVNPDKTIVYNGKNYTWDYYIGNFLRMTNSDGIVITLFVNNDGILLLAGDDAPSGCCQRE